MKDFLIRQYDLIPEKVLDQEINIIGAGAIGGLTTFSLAKMGFTKIRVFDFDTVSIENMNSQFYRFRDIGNLKVLALRSLILDFTPTRIEIEPRAYENEQLSGIVVCALDSMKCRRQVFEAHKMSSQFTRAIIDPRMGAENALLYFFDPKREEECETYEKSLYGDSAALQEPCTAKATIYTASLLSGLVVKAIKDIVTNQPERLKSAFWDIKANDCQLFNKSVA